MCNYFYSKTETFLDYISKETIIFIDEIGKIKARADNIKNDTNILIETLLEKQKIVPEVLENLKDYKQIEEEFFRKQCIYLEN